MESVRSHKLCYLSSYDRGLQYLLFMWEEIRKEYPDAELHIAYGWNNFDKIAGNNPERMKWKAQMEMLMEQPGIFHYGRVNKEKLNTLMDQCGILAYSTDFYEISCLTALHCQKHGCVPVVANPTFDLQDGSKTFTALDENVFAGIKVNSDIRTEEGQKSYLAALMNLMCNPVEWKRLSTEGKKGWRKFHISNVAEEWNSEFVYTESPPLVTIITPTIRKGFWNIMAHNIASQTYPNIQWVVVDDFPTNRNMTMRKYCQKWRVTDWKYIRGGKTDKYHYGLSTANNLGWKNSDGELLVWLQDFMLMPPQGIEVLVDIYRKHPDCLIAPTDINCTPLLKPDTDKEDWFDGQLEVIGDIVFNNIRNKKLGMRYTENPADWEVNYGAVPKKIVDDLGGWYDFFNDGLGFDNTEFAYRALLAGYRIIIDDTNQAVGINHWEALKNNQKELGEKRTHRLNDPRYIWMQQKIKEGVLPIKRVGEDGIKLHYEIPESVSNEEAVKWMRENMITILNSWSDVI